MQCLTIKISIPLEADWLKNPLKFSAVLINEPPGNERSLRNLTGIIIDLDYGSGNCCGSGRSNEFNDIRDLFWFHPL